MDPVQHCFGAPGIAKIANALGLPRYSGRPPEQLIRLALLRRSLSTRRFFRVMTGVQSSVGTADLRVHAGYWQNLAPLEPYLRRVADACVEVFSLRPSGETCLHVRLGDYDTPKNRTIYSQIGPAYYVSALRYLQEKYSRKYVRVLTNDPKSALRMFADPAFSEYEFRLEPGSSLTDFAAIAQSSALVASNSTFCWWGALTSARMGSLNHLVSPVHWFNPGYRHREAPSYSTLPDLAFRV